MIFIRQSARMTTLCVASMMSSSSINHSAITPTPQRLRWMHGTLLSLTTFVRWWVTHPLTDKQSLITAWLHELCGLTSANTQLSGTVLTLVHLTQLLGHACTDTMPIAAPLSSPMHMTSNRICQTTTPPALQEEAQREFSVSGLECLGPSSCQMSFAVLYRMKDSLVVTLGHSFIARSLVLTSGIATCLVKNMPITMALPSGPNGQET